ncbi:MAG: 30S ribosomal protein S6 [Firmicutes bacterium]|nr:30S ribosomal protein S6 [Bacillota bacterium]
MEQNKYELGVIVRADLDDEALQAEMDRVRGLLDRFGATIEKEDKWGRRKLAYPIAKQPEGVYTFITYSAPSSTPREVESRLRLMENVLRFLTINLNEAEAKKTKAKTSGPEVVEAVVVEKDIIEDAVATVEETVVNDENTVVEDVTVTVEEPAEETAE